LKGNQGRRVCLNSQQPQDPMNTSSSSAADRVIRVFVSSTFRDMHAERDGLIKNIFPQLRKLCAERAVTWTEVDLRWGITDVQSAENRMLPLCFAEIERCRGWFIGLLGERYSSAPESMPADLLEAHPWLSSHLQRSVTELEILHGVLRSPAMSDTALFYFRLNNLASLLAADNRLEEAELLMRRVIFIHGKIRGTTGHELPETRQLLHGYARLLQQLGLSQEQIVQRIQDAVRSRA
jgi:hypothetical protein